LEPFKKIALILFISFACNSLRANGIPGYSSSIGFVPTTAFHFGGQPGFEFEYEIFSNRRFSPFIEFNWLNDVNKMYTFNTNSFKGFAFGAGVKHYLEWEGNQHEYPFKYVTNSSFYVDAGFKLSKSQRGRTGTFVTSDSVTYSDNYISQRIEHLVFSDVGVKVCIRRFYFDTKFGFGLNWRRVEHLNRTNINDDFYARNAEYYFFEFEKQGNRSFLTGRLKISIGYNLFPVPSTFTFN
jgi:hypothetical protein